MASHPLSSKHVSVLKGRAFRRAVTSGIYRLQPLRDFASPILLDDLPRRLKPRIEPHRSAHLKVRLFKTAVAG
jgi:hypothetical protein